uniref:Amine oxidase n=1 Tax=Catharus ustulatus TaxID=91951 RepID=A0A8C3TQV8_CATUS
MGASSYELARGVDCPETAAFLDAHHLLDADGPVRFPNALCVFELPTGVPLRRHFDSDFQGGFNFYAGLEGRALVLRTTSTVYNYDYIWDFLLYPNGVLEAKVHATGYIHATFYTPEGRRYGSRVHSHLLGNIHTHLVHYKVDLDVAGSGNSFETMDIGFENISNPWSAGARVVQPRLQREPRRRERDAALPLARPAPRYLLFSNPRRRNRWGHRRTFRLQLSSHAGPVLPRGWREERGVTWARYHLAVTRRHENEPSSSSMYSQNDPWDPPVTFESFIRDNETIEDQVTPGCPKQSPGDTRMSHGDTRGDFPSPRWGHTEPGVSVWFIGAPTRGGHARVTRDKHSTRIGAAGQCQPSPPASPSCAWGVTAV